MFASAGCSYVSSCKSPREPSCLGGREGSDSWYPTIFVYFGSCFLLQAQAQAAGGRVVTLLGNHELMLIQASARGLRHVNELQVTL